VVIDPIHQFRIQNILGPWNIFGYDIAFTNSNLFMGIIVLLTVGFLLFASSPKALVPGRVQSVGEMWYEFIHKMVREMLGEEGKPFFPFVFSLFSFVLVANMLGMFPYFFTVTSQIAVTGAMAVFVILLVIVVGIWKHGLHWFGLFWPSGMPTAMKFVVAPIEVISFLMRPVSLALRLFGNMLAGHMVLKVFAGFVVSLIGAGGFVIIGSIAPMFMAVALTALEFLVAFLQAFVFAILTCVYLNDALHPGH
jgi:F-type H+-transporting ATPase subunit a